MYMEEDQISSACQKDNYMFVKSMKRLRYHRFYLPTALTYV